MYILRFLGYHLRNKSNCTHLPTSDEIQQESHQSKFESFHFFVLVSTTSASGSNHITSEHKRSHHKATITIRIEHNLKSPITRISELIWSADSKFIHQLLTESLDTKSLYQASTPSIYTNNWYQASIVSFYTKHWHQVLITNVDFSKDRSNKCQSAFHAQWDW